MKKMSRNIMLTLVLLSFLSACGFHLRGVGPSYNKPVAIYLNLPAQNASLAQEVLRGFEQQSIDTQKGTLVLTILREVLTRQETPVSRSNQTSEYSLVYTLFYSTEDTQSNKISQEQIILTRSYQYNPSNIVGKTIEEETLLQELRKDAVQQLARKITLLVPQISVEPEVKNPSIPNTKVQP